jgi:hypothetical protein
MLNLVKKHKKANIFASKGFPHHEIMRAISKTSHANGAHVFRPASQTIGIKPAPRTASMSPLRLLSPRRASRTPSLNSSSGYPTSDIPLPASISVKRKHSAMSDSPGVASNRSSVYGRSKRRRTATVQAIADFSASVASLQRAVDSSRAEDRLAGIIESVRRVRGAVGC